MFRVAELLDTNETLQAQLDQQSSTVTIDNDSLQKISLLEAGKQVLEVEVASLQERFAALTQEKCQWEEAKTTMEEEMKSLEEENVARDQFIGTLEKEKKALEEEKSSWTGQGEEASTANTDEHKKALEQLEAVKKGLEDDKTALEQKNKAMEHELVKTVGRTSEYEHRTTMMETQLKQMKSKWEDATTQLSSQEKSVTYFLLSFLSI
jgi:chromosome segregation ATPase